jgi:hypothetical protein
VAVAAQAVYRGTAIVDSDAGSLDPDWDADFASEEPVLPAELVARALEYELRDYPEVLDRLVRALGVEAYLSDSSGLTVSESV